MVNKNAETLGKVKKDTDTELTNSTPPNGKQSFFLVLVSALAVTIILLIGSSIGELTRNPKDDVESTDVTDTEAIGSELSAESDIKNEIISNDSSSFTKTITVDGEKYQQVNVPVTCMISTEGYTIDSSGYLKKDGKSLSTSLAFYGGTSNYTKYGYLDCTTDRTTVRYTLADGYRIQPTLSGAYRYDRDDENQTISIYIDNLSVYADGSIGYAVSNDYNYGKKIFFLSNEGQESEAYYIKLNPGISDEHQSFLSAWRSKINNYKTSSSYDSSSTSSSSSSTTQKFEKYCREMFPGNDVYDKTARESCIRSAQATYELMTE